MLKRKTAPFMVMTAIGLIAVVILVICIIEVENTKKTKSLHKKASPIWHHWKPKTLPPWMLCGTASGNPKLAAQKDALLQKLDSSELDPFSLFQDFVIMGDSRILHLYNESMLEGRHILAGGGHTIRNIPEYYNEIEALNPSYIFLCYGLNDVSIGYWG